MNGVRTLWEWEAGFFEGELRFDPFTIGVVLTFEPGDYLNCLTLVLPFLHISLAWPTRP